jgi:hypothetical protein
VVFTTSFEIRICRPNGVRGCAAALLFLLSFAGDRSHADALIDELVRRFSESDIQFQRTESDVPFVPVAWLSASDYQETQFVRPDGSSTDLSYRQSSFSEGALLPLPLGKRDAVVIGEWVSTTNFHLESTNRDFSVLSVAVPVGWIRQLNPDWQVAAFAAPLGSKTRDEGWYWETLGGAFAHYTRNDRLSWVFGAYFDVAPLEDFYTPYLGATYAFNEHWTLDAIIPWPGVNCAPNPNTLLRVGVSPSDASWTVEQDVQHPRVSLSVWNLGLHAEHRVLGPVWLAVEGGVSGLRGLSIIGGQFDSLQIHMSHTAYVSLTINIRPAAPSSAMAIVSSTN